MSHFPSGAECFYRFGLAQIYQLSVYMRCMCSVCRGRFMAWLYTILILYVVPRSLPDLGDRSAGKTV